MSAQTLTILSGVVLLLVFVLVGWHVRRKRRPGRRETEGAPALGAGVGGRGATRDPVCGMLVEAGRAAAEVEHRGATYRFCSLDCHDRFVREPGRFA